MRNIRLAYILTFLNYTWFWMGIWVLYYLRFTDYAGIGFVETVMIVTRIATEIPTGAIADIFGRKKTIIASFFLNAVAGITMSLAGNMMQLIIAVLLTVIAVTLYSGTMDALLYDTLKEQKKEKKFEKIISHASTIQLISFAICSAVGGFLYVISPSLPFIAAGIAKAVGVVFAFFLIEPHIDSEHFSWKNFVKQNREGFRELFKSAEVRKQTIYLMIVGCFLVLLFEVVEDLLIVEFGFQASQLGIIMALGFLFGAFFSQFTAKFSEKFSPILNVTLMAVLIAIALIVSPVIGMIVGAILFIFRTGPLKMIENVTSVVINRNTESQYRATTLSTFNMLQSLPYAAAAILIGEFMDRVSARNFAAFLGVAILSVVVISHLTFLRPTKKAK